MKRRILTGILLSTLWLGGVACSVRCKGQAKETPTPSTIPLSCYAFEERYGHLEHLCEGVYTPPGTDPGDNPNVRIDCDDPYIWCDDEGA